jgi:arginase
MPLSAALGEDNFDCQVNEINPDTAQRWEDLKNIGVHGTKISPENLIYFESATPKKRKARKN